MWQRKSQYDIKMSSQNVFKPFLRRYRFQSNTLRITLDPTHVDQIGIQAISK